MGRLLLVAPAAVLFLGLFVAPFLWFLLLSVLSMRSYRLAYEPTWANYAQTIGANGGTLLLTLGLAFVVASLAVLLGLLYAYHMRFRAPRWAGLMLSLAVLTLFGGYLMKIYAWKTILGTEGVLNGALLWLGLADRPLTALFYNPGAVVVTLVNFLLPLAILPIYSSLRGIGDIEVEAARDLGASPGATLRDVILPRAAPGLAGAFALCFLSAVGDYVTPALVGGTTTTMGSLIAPQFGSFFNWPLGAAMSVVTLASSALLLWGAARLWARLLRGRR